MPADGVPALCHEDLLSFEEIAEVVRAAVSLGVTKVRLTGGEPLVRRGIVSLVALLAEIEGIQDLAMTTNGQRLAACASDLAEAGLHRVNVSVDTLDPVRYGEITRGGNLGKVIDGIYAARETGLTPIKLNCVIRDSIDEEDARSVAEFGRKEGLEVRYIRRMNLSAGLFHQVLGGTGGDCAHCNRLRLSCDGYLRPCLFSDLRFDVRKLGPAKAIQEAVQAKPEHGEKCATAFNIIGG